MPKADDLPDQKVILRLEAEFSKGEAAEDMRHRRSVVRKICQQGFS